MSLAEIEKHVLELPEEDRRSFANWFLVNQGKIVPPPVQEEPGETSEIMTELRLRKREYLDHPERFRRVESKGELDAYFNEIRDEVRARVSSARSARPGRSGALVYCH